MQNVYNDLYTLKIQVFWGVIRWWQDNWKWLPKQRKNCFTNNKEAQNRYIFCSLCSRRL